MIGCSKRCFVGTCRSSRTEGAMRVLRRALAFGFVLCLPADFSTAADANLQLFGRDIGKEKAYACYARTYTKAHLASHPDQNVRDMMVFVDSYEDESGA